MVNATQPFSWIEYFDITIQSKSNKTLVATLILPVSDENQIKEIISSKNIKPEKHGSISLSFSVDNRLFTYHFKKTKEGLVLD